MQPKQDPPKPVVEEKLCFDKAKFEGYQIVRLRLLREGTIQYDPAFPELVLDTSDSRGKLMPLTPFFKGRIGSTLDIVLE